MMSWQKGIKHLVCPLIDESENEQRAQRLNIKDSVGVYSAIVELDYFMAS